MTDHYPIIVDCPVFLLCSSQVDSTCLDSRETWSDRLEITKTQFLMNELWLIFDAEMLRLGCQAKPVSVAESVQPRIVP